jgi:anti-anti-sigma factor
MTPEQPAMLRVAMSREGDAVIVVWLSGQLDLSTVDATTPAIAEIRRERPARVVFDLRNLEFMDSSGIAMLLTVLPLTDEILLRRPSETIRNVIQLTGLEETLRFSE